MRVLGRGWLSLVCAVLLGTGLVVGCGAPVKVVKPDTPVAGDARPTPQQAPAGGKPDYAALLTPADVERVSGLTGLKTVPYDPAKGAGGKVNIAEADGHLVAMLLVEGPEFFRIWKGDGRTYLRAYTPTVGEESFVGPAKGIFYIFGFRKGSYAVVIDTYFRDKGATTILSVDQVARLAEIVASRL